MPLIAVGTQVCPVWQSISVMQVLLHAPLTHKKGAQSRSPGSRQVPCPSHVREVLSSVSPEHAAGPQGVFSGKSAQDPNASQNPVVSQVVRLLALHAMSGAPASKNVHRPTDPVWLHATHAPAQATLQQTPSVQWPEVQSSSPLQVDPFIFLPQLLFTHCWPAAHWALVVQVVAHLLMPGSQL